MPHQGCGAIFEVCFALRAYRKWHFPVDHFFCTLFWLSLFIFVFFYFFLILVHLGAPGETLSFAQVRENTIILEIKIAQFSSLIF